MHALGSFLSEPSTLSAPNDARHHGSAINVPTLDDEPLSLSKSLSQHFIERIATVIVPNFPKKGGAEHAGIPTLF